MLVAVVVPRHDLAELGRPPEPEAKWIANTAKPHVVAEGFLLCAYSVAFDGNHAVVVPNAFCQQVLQGLGCAILVGHPLLDLDRGTDRC